MAVASEPIRQGAEAKLYTTRLYDRPTFVKQRFVKTYRHPALDASLSQQRIRNEAKAMLRCRPLGISVPAIYHIDLDKREIHMERVEPSVTVKDHLDALIRQDPTAQVRAAMNRLASAVGQIVARLHVNNIVHGDLTTSNMLVRLPSLQTLAGDVSLLPTQTAASDLVMIDFGLATILSNTSIMTEEKGVDLYVLERAMLSTHPGTEALFDEICRSYREIYASGGAEVMKKLEEVRLRGRKRIMVG